MSLYHKLEIDDYDEPELLKIVASIDTEWIDYYNFKATILSADLLCKDDFFRWLYGKYPYQAGIIELPRNTCYNWHRDSSRGVCINMLVNFNGHSHCLFAPDRIEPTAEGAEVTHGFIELKYEPYKRYVFNNQVDHMVINFNEDRYLLTLEFAADKFQLTFDDFIELITLNVGSR